MAHVTVTCADGTYWIPLAKLQFRCPVVALSCIQLPPAGLRGQVGELVLHA